MMNTNRRSSTSASFPVRAELALLVALLAIVAIYAVLRYGGHWGETDTNGRAGDMLSVIRSGQLVPPKGPIYPNGYGFQVIAAFLYNIAGVSVAGLQLYGSALLAIWVVLPAWLAYRELTGSARGATFATLFLLVQPEFLFVILRGTHEKFTRGLMLFCLYLLVRSLRSGHRAGRIISLVLTFYVAGFGIAALNSLLSISFIEALAGTLALIWFVSVIGMPHSQIDRSPVRRLGNVVLSLLMLALLVIFYAYPPAQYDLTFIKDFTKQTAAVVTDTESSATNPYEIVRTGWVSRPVYFAVSLANWILLAVSAALWSWQSLRWLLRRWQPQGRRELVLWALYGAFVLQGTLSIAVDLSGAVGGTLQHRVFPSFAMVAAPVAAAALTGWRPRSARAGWLAYSTLAGVLGVLAVLSVFKATNEPLLSNKWLFYIPAEMHAIEWAETTLPGRSLWVEYDERLSASTGIRTEQMPLSVELDQFDPSEGTRDVLISDVTRARSARLGAPLPVQADSFVTYDNGQAQVYHLRPRTPYQR